MSDSARDEQDAVATPEPEQPTGPTRLRMRRAPRYRAFGVTGAALGALTGLILAMSFSGASTSVSGSDYSSRSVTGYFLAIFLLIGVAAGLGLAVLVERRRGKRD